MRKCDELLMQAKSNLILDHPFFASLLLGMDLVETSTIATAATDGERVLYNPTYVETLNRNEVIFLLAHEVMHCALEHHSRRNGREPIKWNIALDIAVNQLLVEERVGSLKAGWLHSPELYKKGRGTGEGIYDLLPDPPSGKGAGQPGCAQDEVMDASGGSPEEQAAKLADLQVRIAQAAGVARIHSKLSANMQRFIGELTKSRVDWKAVLRRFFSERCKTDWTFARPKRRFLAEDVYLPGLTGESMQDILVAVDCSGSIDDHTLQIFGAELKAIIEDTAPTRTHVLYFDSVVCKAVTFERGEDIKLQAYGGGGTAFSPIFKYAAKKGIAPAACIFLTDLCCDDFGKQPEYPVLWATIGETKAPFGEVLKIDTKGDTQ